MTPPHHHHPRSGSVRVKRHKSPHDVTEPTRSKDVSTNAKRIRVFTHFPSRSAPLRAARLGIPGSPSRSSRYPPFDSRGGNFKDREREKKNTKSRKSFFGPTRLASSAGRRAAQKKAEKRTGRRVCAHFSHSSCPAELTVSSQTFLGASGAWILPRFEL